MLGALFLPSKRSRIWLHRSLLKIKRDHSYLDTNGFAREVKYSKINRETQLEIAKAAVDLFMKCPDCYFRACVVPYSREQLERIGKQRGIPTKIKEAMIYTKSAINLLHNAIPDVRGASLMMDQITRANGDRFDEVVRDKLGSGKQAIFDHIGYIDSKAERTHTIQLCDLLLGAILNEHYPTKSNKLKNEFREYVKEKLKLTSMKKNYWGELSQSEAEKKHPKYTIRFWKLPYAY